MNILLISILGGKGKKIVAHGTPAPSLTVVMVHHDHHLHPRH